ncbi:MAG: aldo/keto reductase [Bacteroidota bacterium]
MQYKQLGNSDVQVSEITFGAWAIGGWLWGGSDERDSIAALHAALDHGISSFDTAPVYGFGYSESLLGQVLKGKRQEVQLLTKYGLRWDLESGYVHKDTIDQNGHARSIKRYATKDSIIAECEASLKRLQTDYIDLYQIHWPDPLTNISESMEAMDLLIQQGKIRAAGVCNYSAGQMAEAQGYRQVVSNQVPYSMVQRKIEQAEVPQAISSHASILAYSPLQRGLLTGKIRPDHSFAEGDTRASSPLFQGDRLRRINAFLDKLRPIADGQGASLAQLVLRWTLEQAGITVVLAGARNPKQVADNAAAADLALSSEELGVIRSELDQLMLT